ncbi:MAG: hypothetical protein AAGB46_06705 [Verrucomicrobiota bacterium]
MNKIRPLGTALLLALLLGTLACSPSGSNDSNGKVETSEIATIFKNTIQEIPAESDLETWRATLQKAIPVERYATNAFQPKLDETQASDLRLPERTSLKIGMPWFINGEMTPPN